jgi:hypothetical protein
MYLRFEESSEFCFVARSEEIRYMPLGLAGGILGHQPARRQVTRSMMLIFEGRSAYCRCSHRVLVLFFSCQFFLSRYICYRGQKGGEHMHGAYL